MKKRNLKKPIISALEQRVLFDGAAVATAVDVLDDSSFATTSNDSVTTNDVTNNSAENSVHEAQAVQGFEKPRREVAFVDVTVKDYQTLVDGVGEGVEVYLVSSLDEIKTTLSSQTNIDAIHILSHGNTGEISVGNDLLNNNTLDDNAQLLEIMKNSLSENGDILLYGCNVASDGTGQEFINSIATLTQADVAASDDITGNSALGGDWELEVKSGIIDTDELIIENYDDKLATVSTFSVTDGPSSTPLTIADPSTIKIAFYPGYLSGSSYDTNLAAYYISQGFSVTTLDGTKTLDQLSISNYDLLISQLPLDGFISAEVTAGTNFLNTGGRIFFIGEHSGFATYNTNISNYVSALGGALSITSASFAGVADSTLNNLNFTDSNINSGVDQLRFNAASYINVDPDISEAVVVDESNNILVGDQAIGLGRITLIADVNPMDTSLNGLSSYDNKIWFRNLAIDSATNRSIVSAGGNPNAGFGMAAASVTVNEDASFSFASDGFKDNNSSVVSKIKITSLPAHGTLTLLNTTVTLNQEIISSDYIHLKYTPTSNYNGTDTFNWQGWSTTNSTYSADVNYNITVTGVNDAPVATVASFTTNEDTLYSGILSVTDIDSSSFTYSINTNASHGTVTITNASTGAYSYTPASNYNGTDSFIFAVSDGTSISTATVDITVNPVNDKPTIESTTTINYTEHDLPVIVSPSVIIGDIDSTTISSATVSITSSFTTGDVLNFTNDNSTSYGNISASYNATTGILTLSSSDSSATMTQWKNALENIKFSISSTIDVVNNGTRTISWKVNDGLLDSLIDTSTINVQGYGSMPYIYGTDKVTVNEDNSLSLSGFVVGDTDTTVLTVSVVSQHGNLSLGTTTGITGYSSATKTLEITGTSADLQNALNSMVYTPDANYNGLDELVIKASDDSGKSWIDYYVSRTGLFYNPTNQHYYEFVSTPLTWDAAKTAAESRTYLGLGGYLATVTSAEENALIASKLGGNGWMGASDATQTWTRADRTTFTTSEGNWTWISGPEAGTQFWQDETRELGRTESVQGYTVNGMYANFASGEPNNYNGNEDVAHFYSNNGTWNDYPNSMNLGYVVEYGGLSTDISSKPAAAKLEITVVSVNDLPVNNNVPSSVTTNEDTSIVFSSANSNAITITDIDATTVTTTLSIGSGKGTLNVVEGNGTTITNNGTTTVQITGTVEQVNSALDGLVYNPTSNANGNAYTTLTISTNDGFATDLDFVTINVTAVDDLPVANSMAATVGVGSAQLFSYFQPNFFDVDNDAPVAIKLTSAPDKGQFEHWNGTSWEIVSNITPSTPLIVAMSEMNDYRFNALSESNTSTTVQWQVKTAGNTSDTGWSNTATGTISILSYSDNTTPSVSIIYPTGTTTGTPTTQTVEAPDSSNPTSSVKTVTSNNVITINEDGQTATITLTYSDSVTPAQFMQGIMTSSNTRLIDFSDSSTYTMTQSVTNNVGTITLILKPKANMYGETLITLGAFDGQKTTQETFTLRVNSVNEQAIVDNFTRTIDEDSSFSFATINPGDIYHDANDVNNNTNTSIVDYNAQMAIIRDAMLNPTNMAKQAAKATAITTLVDANYFPQSFIIDTLPAKGDLYLGTTRITAVGFVIAIADLETLNYVPDANYYGTDSFTWHALDKDDLATTKKTATFSVNSINDAPTISVSTPSGFTESTDINNQTLTQSGTVTFNDIDNNVNITYNYNNDISWSGGTLDSAVSAALISGFSTGATNVSSGTTTWNYNVNNIDLNFLAQGETITLSYMVTVTDLSGVTDTETISFIITGTNDGPTVSAQNIDVELPFGDVYTKDISTLFDDKDLSNVFTYEATNLPLGLTINPDTGVISGRVSQSGIFVISITATDSQGEKITRTYNMLVIAPAQNESTRSNPAPVFDNNTNGGNTNTATNLNNYNTNSNNNMGVINFSSNDGFIADTGKGFVDSGIGSLTNNNQETIFQNNNGNGNTSDEGSSNSNNSQTNTSSNNSNDSRGIIQANVDLNVLTNGQVVFNEGNQDSFSIVGITIEDIKVENNFIEIKVVDTNLSQNFIVTQTDGTPLPAGLFFDPKTGNITGTIPEDLEKLDISIKAINQDGTTRVLNLKLDLKELKNKNQAQADSDEKYIGLKEQIALENQKLDGYGSYLTRLFA